MKSRKATTRKSRRLLSAGQIVLCYDCVFAGIGLWKMVSARILHPFAKTCKEAGFHE